MVCFTRTLLFHKQVPVKHLCSTARQEHTCQERGTTTVVVVVLTFTRIIKSVVTGQAPVTLELRNTPGKKHTQTKGGTRIVYTVVTAVYKAPHHEQSQRVAQGGGAQRYYYCKWQQ